MAEESEPHEGTWLQWPHHRQYGKEHSEHLDATWIEMTKALTTSENVHIIVYDDREKERVEIVLDEADVNFDKIEFIVHPTDDVWVRDNGPIFVNDKDGNQVIQDWGFNGWGKKADYENCDNIPSYVSKIKGIPSIDLNDKLIIEGGSVEIDGNGTLMATRSAILNDNRNPDMSQADVEKLLTEYLGVTHFVWLDGVAGLEITDMHIDGFARFGNSKTIVTMNETDLVEWQVPEVDIKRLYEAKNSKNQAYSFVKLPLTKNDVITTYGKKLGYKGSYVNYYIANKVVLVPNYEDVNDEKANAIIQKLYPGRRVVGIDVRNLYANGGMIHCVTQQQPK